MDDKSQSQTSWYVITYQHRNFDGADRNKDMDMYSHPYDSCGTSGL